ncbi:MAG TPA: hypothetical protein VIU35_13635 [Chitinophagaceae bacterium]
MRRIFYTLFICSLFFSCKKDTPGDCTPDQYSYEFYPSSKIDTTTTDMRLFFQIKPGNDLVFSYTHEGPACKSIADEEYSDKLVFQVPASSNSFLYENSQLADAMCLFIKIAFWTNGAYKVNSGFVKGTKKSATKWDVEINVDVGGSIGRINLKKTFVQH